MTALPDPFPPSAPLQTQLLLHQLFLRAMPFIISRAQRHFANLPHCDREELVAEAVAAGYTMAASLVRRGRTDKIRTKGFAAFAVRVAASGRKTGSPAASRDAMSTRGRRRHNREMRSLDAMLDNDAAQADWEEALADRDDEGPDEVVRRSHDYEHILSHRRVSDKARATFHFLAETHGTGKQSDLAETLGVKPGRITQLKRELGVVLADHGYSGPLGRRPAVQ